jgi:modification methylase
MLLESGLLQPGQKLYFGKQGEATATILANGHLTCNGLTGSIHQVGKALQDGPCNGWEAWYYQDEAGDRRLVIDHLRQALRQAMGW